MAKNLVRMVLTLIFTALVLANLSLAFANIAPVPAGKGTTYTGPAGDTVCICDGTMCRPCAAFPAAN